MMAAGSILRGFPWGLDGLGNAVLRATKGKNLALKNSINSAIWDMRPVVGASQGSVPHRPAGHGNLEYDCSSGKWLFPHPDARIQQMAQCYLESYMLKRSSRQVLTSIASASSANND